LALTNPAKPPLRKPPRQQNRLTKRMVSISASAPSLTPTANSSNGRLAKARHHQGNAAKLLGLTYHQFRALYRKHRDEL
jgi:hypothetical protein